MVGLPEGMGDCSFSSVHFVSKAFEKASDRVDSDVKQPIRALRMGETMDIL